MNGVRSGGRMSITREDILTVKDAAQLLGVSTYTIMEYARRGVLPGRKLGRSWRFIRTELEDAIQQLTACGNRPGRLIQAAPRPGTGA